MLLPTNTACMWILYVIYTGSIIFMRPLEIWLRHTNISEMESICSKFVNGIRLSRITGEPLRNQCSSFTLCIPLLLVGLVCMTNNGPINEGKSWRKEKEEKMNLTYTPKLRWKVYCCSYEVNMITNKHFYCNFDWERLLWPFSHAWKTGVMLKPSMHCRWQASHTAGVDALLC